MAQAALCRGLVFYRSVERGKCFIEYISAENAWVPIAADGWLYINCLWVSGAMKGTAARMTCWKNASAMQEHRAKRASAFCAPRDASGNFSPTPSFCPTRDLKSQMSRTVESPSCASRSTPIQHCRNSRTALSTLKLMEKLRSLLHRSVSLYLLLGAEGAAGRAAA